VSSKGKFVKCASFLALLLLVAGCGGLRAEKSVSLLDLLMPGFGGFLQADPPPANPNPIQYAPAAVSVKQVA
jgi:hypothetical protein